MLRLARAFEARGEGTLTFVGDGPLRAALEGRPGIELAGRVAHDEVPAWIAASDVVCQPSLVEPFGLATLEAMASARSVVATRVGGPPEFVTPESGVLVDPEDEHALDLRALAGSSAAPAEPRSPRCRGRPRRQAAGGAGGGDSRASRSRSASLTSTRGRTESSSPASVRNRERLLVGLAHLLGRDALLQPVVAGDEELLDPLARIVADMSRRYRRCYPGRAMPWLQISAVIQVLLSAFMVTLILMHSGREAGMGGLGLHAALAGRNAHRGAEPHAPDGGRRRRVHAQHDRSVPPSRVESPRLALVAELVDALG